MNLAIMYDDPEKGQDAAGGGAADQPDSGVEPEVGIADGTEEEGEDFKIV